MSILLFMNLSRFSLPPPRLVATHAVVPRKPSIHVSVFYVWNVFIPVTNPSPKPGHCPPSLFSSLLFYTVLSCTYVVARTTALYMGDTW